MRTAVRYLIISMVLVGASTSWSLAAGGLDKDTQTKDPKVAALAKELHGKGWIVYGALCPRADMDLWACRPDGSDVWRVTNTPEYHEGAPRFSPDGKQLLYRRIHKSTRVHHNRWGYQGHVVVCRSDGTEAKVLGKDGEHPWACWSPDGTKISCLTLKGIVIIDLATNTVVRKLPRKGMYQQLFWSPDGKWFCGVTNKYGEMWTIARMHAETGEMNRVKKGPKPEDDSDDFGGAACTPDWFPDSKHILFSHKPPEQARGGFTQLWMAGGDGKNPRMVYAEDGRHLYGGTLSPDGKYLLFSKVMLDGIGGLVSCTGMGITPFSDKPLIGGKSTRTRRLHPEAEQAVVVHLPVGYEPDWTYTDIKSLPR